MSVTVVSVIVVLDTEAVSLLTSQRRHDPGRRHLLAHLEGADNVITPSVVRVEALVPRDARHADVNRLVRDAEDLPQLRRRASHTADAAARARSSLDGEVEVVHAVVGATAAAVPGEAVEVLTSDMADLTAIISALEASVEVVVL